jgi:hypothetical protein
MVKSYVKNLKKCVFEHLFKFLNSRNSKIKKFRPWNWKYEKLQTQNLLKFFKWKKTWKNKFLSNLSNSWNLETQELIFWYVVVKLLKSSEKKNWAKDFKIWAIPKTLSKFWKIPKYIKKVEKLKNYIFYQKYNKWPLK